MACGMALKKTSQLLNIGSTITFSDGDVNVSARKSLPLNSLDREVFVVTDISVDSDPLIIPQLPGQDVSLNFSVNKNETTVQTINNPDAVAHFRKQVTSTPVGDTVQVTAFPSEASTGITQDFLGIISTSDYVLCGSYSSTGGGDPDRRVYVRMTGYRATASADVYAALVAEELSSN
jgi:hypothetical protein